MLLLKWAAGNIKSVSTSSLALYLWSSIVCFWKDIPGVIVTKSWNFILSWAIKPITCLELLLASCIDFSEKSYSHPKSERTFYL